MERTKTPVLVLSVDLCQEIKEAPPSISPDTFGTVWSILDRISSIEDLGKIAPAITFVYPREDRPVLAPAVQEWSFGLRHLLSQHLETQNIRVQTLMDVDFTVPIRLFPSDDSEINLPQINMEEEINKLMIRNRSTLQSGLAILLVPGSARLGRETLPFPKLEPAQINELVRTEEPMYYFEKNTHKEAPSMPKITSFRKNRKIPKDEVLGRKARLMNASGRHRH